MIVHQILVDMEEPASTPTMDITAGCILDVISTIVMILENASLGNFVSL